MHAVELPYCNFKTQIPSAWNELSRKNLIDFCRLMLWHDAKVEFLLHKYNGSQHITPDDIKNTVGLQFRKSLFQKFINHSLPRHITTNEVMDFAATQTFLFNEEAAIENWLIPYFFLPAYRCNPFPFFGPGNMLQYITVAEISYADMYLNQYIATQQVQWLDKLIACIYRLVTPVSLARWFINGGDIRPAFNDNLVERHARRVASLPMYIKLAVFYLYKSARVLDQQINAPIYQNHGQQASKLGWAAVIISLAGDKAGTIQQVQQMLYSDAVAMFLKAEEDRVNLEQNHKPTK